MNNYNATMKFSSYYVSFVFIIGILMFNISNERNLLTPADYCYYDNPLKTELVNLDHPESNSTLHRFITTLDQKIDFSQSCFDRLLLYQLVKINYENIIHHKLLYLERYATPFFRCNLIQQKTNILHQSSDDDPLLT